MENHVVGNVPNFIHHAAPFLHRLMRKNVRPVSNHRYEWPEGSGTEWNHTELVRQPYDAAIKGNVSFQADEHARNIEHMLFRGRRFSLLSERGLVQTFAGGVEWFVERRVEVKWRDLVSAAVADAPGKRMLFVPQDEKAPHAALSTPEVEIHRCMSIAGSGYAYLIDMDYAWLAAHSERMWLLLQAKDDGLVHEYLSDVGLMLKAPERHTVFLLK